MNIWIKGLICIALLTGGCAGLLGHQPMQGVSFARTEATASCADDIANGASLGIEAVPASADSEYHRYYCKYTKIVAPNGQPIEIFAQDQISNEQMVRARRILAFFLEDVPGSPYGADKREVANQMARNEAKLVLINGTHDHDNLSPAELDGQPLHDTELIVEGSPAYINNDYENHRDASFEEILHLVHDTGIGVDGSNNTQPGALPNYQARIRAATNNAMANNYAIWPLDANSNPDTRSWLDELADENSLTQEYLAAVVDSYYGYWGAYTETDLGMWDVYIAKTRADVVARDPQGAALMDDFFNPYITYMVRIDSSFNGTFLMAFDAQNPYTYKSQYLLNTRLTGNNNSNLAGNAQNNQLQGNAGDNVLDGAGGSDTAIFVGNRADYTISVADSSRDVVTVTDHIGGRDGTDTAQNIEFLQFADQTVAVVDIDSDSTETSPPSSSEQSDSCDANTAHPQPRTIGQKIVAFLNCNVYLPLVTHGASGANSETPSPVPTTSPTPTPSPPLEDIGGETHIGGCVLRNPVRAASNNIYSDTGVVQTNEYGAFTKKVVVYGITLIAKDEMPNAFLDAVAKTIKEMFVRNETTNLAQQEAVLQAMYRYHALIPVVFSEADLEANIENVLDIEARSSACDIIMNTPDHQAMEVIEHILHYVTNIGLHYTSMNEFGLSHGATVYQTMQTAIANGHYSIESYHDDMEEQAVLDRVRIQEYAYWLITSAWNLQEPYGLGEDEWLLANSESLQQSHPAAYELFESVIPAVMSAPSRATLDAFGS